MVPRGRLEVASIQFLPMYVLRYYPLCRSTTQQRHVSQIVHSCSPSARPSFSSGTSELSLIATKQLKKGDEITMSYVDVSQHPNESPEQARRRRRQELARGWRFKCECERCLSEATDGADSDVGIEKDESKVEDVVKRVEAGAEAYLQAK